LTPFAIRLVDRLVENSILQPVRLKLDPGSRATGLAIVRESASPEGDCDLHVIAPRFGNRLPMAVRRCK